MTERTIRMLAKEMAEETWEANQDPKQASDRFRKLWPDKRQFIGRNWPSFVPIAKATMIAMLKDKSTSESVKEAISEALIEENTKNANRKGATVGKGKLNLNPFHPGAMERKIFHHND